MAYVLYQGKCQISVAKGQEGSEKFPKSRYMICEWSLTRLAISLESNVSIKFLGSFASPLVHSQPKVLPRTLADVHHPSDPEAKIKNLEVDLGEVLLQQVDCHLQFA